MYVYKWVISHPPKNIETTVFKPTVYEYNPNAVSHQSKYKGMVYDDEVIFHKMI